MRVFILEDITLNDRVICTARAWGAISQYKSRRHLLAVGILSLALAPLSGCLVSQPHGKGELNSIRDPNSKREYWLYLPPQYVKTDPLARKQRRWPLVVTFHGMKPFDHASWQAHEWEAEADRYGMIVCAPVLRAADVMSEFPLKRLHPAMKQDEEASLSIMRHVFATTEADPGNVLATGFSSGGYMAHYMLNRHPENFTCLAVRQANFSAGVLDGSMVPRSQRTPIMVIYTEKDMGICKEESQAAVQWYERFGYSNIGWVKLKNLGHVRTPDLAADFFGRVAGVTAARPPSVMRQRHALAGNARGLQFMAGGIAPQQQPQVAAAVPLAIPASDVTAVRNAPPPTQAPPQLASARRPVRDYESVRGAGFEERRRPSPNAADDERLPSTRRESRNARQASRTPQGPSDARLRSAARSEESDRERERRERKARERVFGEWPLDESTRPITASSDARGAGPQRQTPPRTAGAALKGADQTRYASDSAQPVAIRVSSAIGIEPLSLGYWADCPRDWQRSADFVWTLDGKPIGSGINGQKTLADAGDHTLGLTVTLRDGQQFRSARRIRVLPPAPSNYYTQARR